MKKITLLTFMLFASIFANAQFTTQGVATSLGTGMYNLTPLGGCPSFVAGAIWANGLYSAGAPMTPQFLNFNYCFQVNFAAKENMGPGGADGFAVVFGMNINPGTLPNGTSAYLGYYDPINPACTVISANPAYQHSLAVEFDIFNNNYLPCFSNDIPSDHTQISCNGSLASIGTPSVAKIIPGVGTTTIQDNIFHAYAITWDPSTYIMNVIVDGHLRTTTTLSAVSMMTIFGTPTPPAAVQWGFTGATGGLCTDQIIANISVDACGPKKSPNSVLAINQEATNLNLSPNPNNGNFTLSGIIANSTAKTAALEVINVLGEVVYKDEADIIDGSINKAINLGAQISSGAYIIRVNLGNDKKLIKFSITR